ncbi:Histidine kinase 2 [Ceratocystis fimbriata CBS 114723]|uniref:Histidine kinase 2 n=1 Tax=Ceratocystis fimbriata CBS 114723 TaxID=1035309 RepID=A0A2C5WVC6_9PEZI|nr:Histidine kinase 2 [Ceratocystis fimbriata CBS 114723]
MIMSLPATGPEEPTVTHFDPDTGLPHCSSLPSPSPPTLTSTSPTTTAPSTTPDITGAASLSASPPPSPPHLRRPVSAAASTSGSDSAAVPASSLHMDRSPSMAAASNPKSSLSSTQPQPRASPGVITLATHADSDTDTDASSQGGKLLSHDRISPFQTIDPLPLQEETLPNAPPFLLPPKEEEEDYQGQLAKEMAPITSTFDIPATSIESEIEFYSHSLQLPDVDTQKSRATSTSPVDHQPQPQTQTEPDPQPAVQSPSHLSHLHASIPVTSPPPGPTPAPAPAPAPAPTPAPASTLKQHQLESHPHPHPHPHSDSHLYPEPRPQPKYELSPSQEAQSYQPIPTPSSSTHPHHNDKFDDLVVDFLEPDPRPTFVVKLHNISATTHEASPVQILPEPPLTVLPLSLFDHGHVDIHAASSSISTISTSSALDDLNSGLSASSTQPSSAPSDQTLALESAASTPHASSITVPASVFASTSASASASAPVLESATLPMPVLTYCNPAFEYSPAFAAVLDALKSTRSREKSALDVRQNNLWKWILSVYTDQPPAYATSETQTPKYSTADRSSSPSQHKIAVHFGTPWAAYVVRRQWVVVSAKNAPQLPMPTVEIPMSMGMTISMSQDQPFDIPLPLSPPIHEVMFDFSTATAPSTSTSTTSIEETGDSTILPQNDTNTENQLKKIESEPKAGQISPPSPSLPLIPLAVAVDDDARSKVDASDGIEAGIDVSIDIDTELTIGSNGSDVSEPEIATERLLESSKSNTRPYSGPKPKEIITRDLPLIKPNDLQTQLRLVADILPIGMCLSSPHGTIQFANKEWYRILGISESSNNILSCVADEHHGNIERAFDQLDSEDSVTFEFRTRPQEIHETGGLYESDNDDDISEHIAHGERYMMATAKAERRPNGRVIRVLTCLTDITAQKRSSAAAWRRAQDAENLKRMAEHATVGMYHTDRRGRIFSANDVFFQMIGQERVDLHETEIMLWDLAYRDEENGIFEDSLKYVAATGRSWTHEMRLKTTWMADDGYGGQRPAPRWVVATVLPIHDVDGLVTSFTGCISDISDQKWQTERERQHKEEAIESKRQQENLIDMTSHEMRNPLGSIIQCADDIVNTLNEILEEFDISAASNVTSAGDGPDSPSETCPISTPYLASHFGGATSPRQIPSSAQARRLQMIEDCMEDAETIVECAQHQKRIVDDILTLSKLDAKLLMVTPVTADPVDMVNKAVKMFEAEARRLDINLSFTVDKSFSSRGLSFLDFDPSRVTQVLINLLSNALKFTQGRSKRNISVCLKASDQRPEPPFSTVNFNNRLLPRNPSAKINVALAHNQEKAAEEAPAHDAKTTDNSNRLYLLFEVEDTGKGLTEEEARSLFSRFYQGNSHTHVKYGGSGLGLFISRRLTKLQHGDIGVKSKAGEGSTFAFFIEATLPPAPVVDEAKSAAAKSSKPFSAQRRERKLRKANNTPAAEVIKEMSRRKTSLISKLCARTFPAKPSPAAASAVETLIKSNSNVLVVEDNSINARVTKKALNENGFNVQVVTNGLEAIDKLKSQSLVVKAVSSQIDAACANELEASPSLPSPSRAPVPTAFRSRRSSSSIAGATTSTSGLGSRRTASSMSLNGLSSLNNTNVHAPAPAPALPATSPITVPLPDPSMVVGMVLMDMEMPIQNGIECTRQIRQMERDGRIVCASGGRLPIIAISGHARAEQLQRAREAGCDDVMVKPFRIPDLLQTMKTVYTSVVEDTVVEGSTGSQAETKVEVESEPKPQSEAK